MLSPQGRVIMVTGANRGIGNAIARCLHGKGYTLSLGARDVAALDTAVADFADARVVTTLAQGDLPRDKAILDAVTRHIGANLGVYADVVVPGTISRDDVVMVV